MSASLRRHRAALGYLVLVVALLIGIARVELLARDGAEAHAALCSLRADFDRRIEATETYIDEVRSGERQAIPGLTVSDFVRSLRGLRQTRDSLGDLGCDD